MARKRKRTSASPSFPLGFGPTPQQVGGEIGEGLQKSGVQVLEGLSGVKEFVNYLNLKAGGAIQNLLNEVEAAANRSFDLFADGVRSNFARLQARLAEQSQRGRNRIREELQRVEGQLGPAQAAARFILKGDREKQGGVEFGPSEKEQPPKPQQGKCPEGYLLGEGPGGEAICVPVGMPVTPSDRPPHPISAPAGSTGPLVEASSPFPPFTPTPIAPFPPVSGPSGTLADMPMPEKDTTSGYGERSPGGIYLPPYPPGTVPQNLYVQGSTCPAPQIQVVSSPFPVPNKPVPGTQPSRLTFSAATLCKILPMIRGRALAGGIKWSDFFGDACNKRFGGVDSNGIPDLVGYLIDLLLASFCELGEGIWSALNTIVRNAAGTPVEAWPATMTRIALGFFEQWLSTDIGELKLPIVYAARESVQTGIPTAQEATMAWLSNTIDNELYNCLVRYNNQPIETWHKITRASRSRLDAGQLLSYSLRNNLGWDWFRERMRDIGWIDTKDILEFYSLRFYQPPSSDLIRYMVRDVEDKKLVAKFGLLEGFDQKFKGQVETWATGQGLTREVMEAEWISSRHLPSPTQLYEMYHRLRYKPPGAVDRVTREDIEESLRQQDFVPFWIPKLLAISFRPLRLVDIRRAFEVGSFTIKNVRDGLIDHGYSDSNADLMAKYWQDIRGKRFLKHAAIRRYANFGISKPEFNELLEEDGATKDDIDAAYRRALLLMGERRKVTCLAALKKRYFRGEIEDVQLVAVAQDQGLNPDQAHAWADMARCERSARGKLANATVLCHRLERGVIDPVEYVRSLLRLGFDRREAERMLSDCGFSIDEKKRKLANVLLQKQEAKRRIAEKQIEKESARLERLAEKRNRGLAEAEKANTRRAASFIRVAQELAKRMEVELEEALRPAQRARRILTQEFLLSDDQALLILTALVNTLVKPYGGNFESDAKEAATAYRKEIQDGQAVLRQEQNGQTS